MGESGEDSGVDLHCTDYRDPIRLRSGPATGSTASQYHIPGPRRAVRRAGPFGLHYLPCLLRDGPASASPETSIQPMKYNASTGVSQSLFYVGTTG